LGKEKIRDYQENFNKNWKDKRFPKYFKTGINGIKEIYPGEILKTLTRFGYRKLSCNKPG
jgi:hypothetical protein